MTAAFPRMKDQIYAEALNQIGRFAFDDKVADVFSDMIQRSVPGYSTIIAMTGVIAQSYVQTGSKVYDLGCSLGASTLAMEAQTRDRDCEFIGVDNSEAMITRCRTRLDGCQNPVQLLCSDLQDLHFEDASMAVLNFTLQFVPVQERAELINRLAEAMRPGGVLILSEKILFEDPHLQALNTDLHHAFKRGNGYSDLEISQKRDAIENVLIAETLESHKSRLLSAGFTSVDVWFQCFNFASLVAVKGQADCKSSGSDET